MNEELNNTMATKVMGWNVNVYQPNPNYDDYYDCYTTEEDGYTDYVMDREDWHPDTDLNQAMMCARKYCDDNNKTYELNRFRGEEVFSIGNYGEAHRGAIVPIINPDKLPLAICEAIKEAIE